VTVELCKLYSGSICFTAFRCYTAVSNVVGAVLTCSGDGEHLWW